MLRGVRKKRTREDMREYTRSKRDAKTALVGHKGELTHLDLFHTAQHRSPLQLTAERIQPLGLALGLNLHITVGSVANPTAQALHSRLLLGKETIPHALHAPRHGHREALE
jgi:hypothetical protein